MADCGGLVIFEWTQYRMDERRVATNHCENLASIHDSRSLLPTIGEIACPQLHKCFKRLGDLMLQCTCP